MKIRIMAKNDLTQTVQVLEGSPYLGQEYECKLINKTHEQDVIDRLRALWYLLVKVFCQNTGYSQLEAKSILKYQAGYYDRIQAGDESVIIMRSVSNRETTLESLSNLFNKSFAYLSDVFDIGQFVTDYEKITGKTLEPWRD